MKTLVRVVVSIIALIAVVGAIAYADGAKQPINHSTTVEGNVSAPPAKVFGFITNVADAPSWRHDVKAVQVLPPESGQDHWIEDLGHGVTMNFLATGTEPVSADGTAMRKVLLKDPSYGGTWTYVLSPGSSPGETHLKITEDGYINPPIYRFMMAHIFGMTKNLDQYMSDMQAAATKS
jgi:uncharacterized membrane protein